MPKVSVLIVGDNTKGLSGSNVVAKIVRVLKVVLLLHTVIKMSSYRLTAIEQRTDRIEEQFQSRPKGVDDALSVAKVSISLSQDRDEDSDAGDDTVIPTTQFLKKLKHVQSAVHQRVQELSRINEQGMS